MHISFTSTLLLGLALAMPAQAQTYAEGATCLDQIQVLGRRQNLVGASISASQGLVGPTELDARPQLRSSDLLEYVPGLVATQHSGSGKANQFFLRGFNLDHGTVYIGGARLGDTDLVIGAERQGYDGPWTDIDEDVRKSNLTLRASWVLGAGTAYAAFMGYDNRWNSPDQIPQRAIDQAHIDRFGSLDPTLGGDSSRYSLSGGWNGALGGGDAAISAYVIDYDLSLYSNFTYFLDRPDSGDQFRQFDERRIHGVDASQLWQGERGQLRVGATLRQDDIDRIGLSHTQARRFVSAVRDDAVDERSAGVFIDGELRLSERWRTYAGARYDDYDFDVDALQPENSGKTGDGRFSPKVGLALAATHDMELYANVGAGFHSNDARGTTIRVDPFSGDPVDRVDPLVKSEGAELGARLFLSDTVHATAALWRLDLDSELVFVGDAGNTEASRPSSRRGAEFGLYWLGDEGWQAELEAAFTDARFDDADPAGREVPGAIPRVLSAGVSHERESGWFGALRLRRFGGYPLIEDDSVRADRSTLVNLRLGRRWDRWTATLDVFNALDSRDHDIDYYYASRLPGESNAVDDVHFHGFEPRTARLSLRYAFD